MELLALTLVLLGVGLLLAAIYLRRRIGLPSGAIIYSDATGTGQTIRSERYGLVGKPDYLLRQGRYLIPVEVKPGRTAAQPYRSDILQLAAYGLLVEEAYGVAPPYGLIRYQSGSHKVPFTPQLRQELLATIAAMRQDLLAANVLPNHHSPARCAACAYRYACGQEISQTNT